MNAIKYMAALLVLFGHGNCQSPDHATLKIGYTNDLLASMDPCG